MAKKFAHFFTVFLIMTAVYLASSSVTKAIATRDSSNHDIRGLERKLLSHPNDLTCWRPCACDSECSDGWFCKLCEWDILFRQKMCSASSFTFSIAGRMWL
nr:uncharacterized protein LOC104105328 [Nicotiana tomentosiformis]